MSVDLELANRIVGFMNELLEIDGKAVRDLVETRVQCNDALGYHPTVQVAGPPHRPHMEVGMLGILNGLCGTYDDGPRKGWGPLCAFYEDGTLEKIKRFAITENA